MFCPKCGTEYRKGFTTCSDCDVSLVPDPPSEPVLKTQRTQLKKIDEQLLAFERNAFRKNLNEPPIYKLHAISIIVAVGLSINSISPFFYNGYDTFGNWFFVFRVVYALFLIALYVNAVYSCRVYFELRKEGLISDRNYFFSESANLTRKIAFYIALVIDTIHTLRSRVIPENFHETLNKARFATRADFIRDAGQTFVINLAFAIIAVECLRLIYSKSFSWSNRKHFTIISLITITLSFIQLFFRYYFSGHGIFW